MSKRELTGRTALVTGASSGLGVDFARELAARGADLVLVARREDRLRAVADELSRDFGVQVSVVSADLADPATPEMLHQTVGAQHRIDILVNNAGLGVFGEELDIEWARSRQLLQVDVVALAHLSKLFGATCGSGAGAASCRWPPSAPFSRRRAMPPTPQPRPSCCISGKR